MYIFFIAIFAFFLLKLSYFFGKDYESYIDYFGCFTDSLCDIEWEVEPLTLILAKTYGALFSAESLVYLYIFIGLATKYYAVSRMSYTILPIIVYSVTFVPLLELNQIRAAASFGFLIVAIQFYLEGKQKRFIIFSILAISFHLSAILGFAIFIRKYVLFFLCSVFLVIFSFLTVHQILLFSEIFPNISKFLRFQSFASYLIERPTATIFNLKTILLVLLTIPILLKWTKQRNRILLFNNCLILWVSFFGIFFIPQLFSRVFDLFLVIGLFFTFGYCYLKKWYKYILSGFILVQSVISGFFIFGSS